MSQLWYVSNANAEKEWKPDRVLAEQLINLPEKEIEQAFSKIVPEQEKTDYALLIAWRQIFKIREYSKAKIFLKMAENQLSNQMTRHNDWSTLHMLHMTLAKYKRNFKNVILRGKETLKHMDAQGVKSIGRYAYILEAMSWAYYTLGDYQKSLNSSLKIVEKAKSSGDEKEEANALFGAAESYYKLSKLKEAEKAADRAYGLYEKLGDTRGLGHTKKVLGSIHNAKGNLDKAKQSYYIAIRHYQKVRDHHGVANCMYNLGYLHKKTKDYGEAALSFEDAAFHYIKSGSTGGVGMAKMELGKIQELLNSIDQAELLYADARSLLTKSNSMDRMAQLETYYADLYIKQGRKRQAKDSYIRALKIYREANNQRKVTRIEKLINKL